MDQQMTKEEFSEGLIKARSFAAYKHRDQRRKGAAGRPYITHPIAVTELLWREGVRDETTLTGALLHDTVEDTDTKPAELLEHFGQEVHDLVMECTDDKSLPKDERKIRQILDAPDKSVSARAIKIADKISNLTDIVDDPPTHWDRNRLKVYVLWCEAVFRGLKGHHPALDKLFEETLTVAKRKVWLDDASHTERVEKIPEYTQSRLGKAISDSILHLGRICLEEEELKRKGLRHLINHV